MSIGDYVAPTWTNDVTELSQANLQPMSDKVYELDQELYNSRCVNWHWLRDYFYLRNLKDIDNFQSGWAHSGAYSSSSGADTTNYKIGTNGYRITHTSASAGWNVLEKTIGAINILTSNMGDTLSVNDFLIVYVYVSNASAVNNLQFWVGNDSSNSLYYETTTNFVTGWNLYKLKLDDLVEAGTVNYSAIDYLALNWETKAGYNGSYITGQHYCIMRADPDNSAAPYLFQEYTGSVWQKRLTTSYDFTMVIDGTGDSFASPNLLSLTGASYANTLRLTNDLWNCFYFKAYFRIKNDTYCPNISWYVDSNNYLAFYINQSNYRLTIKEVLAGVTTYTILPFSSLLKDTTVLMMVTKVNGIIRVICSNNATVLVVETADNLSSSFGYFYFNNTYSFNSGYLRDFCVSNKSTLVLNSASDLW